MFYYEKKLIAGEGLIENDLPVQYFLTLFQDVAGVHGEIMGVGLEKIRKEFNAFWVVTKTKLEFIKEVKKGEEILLQTFPSSVKPLRVQRDYAIKNAFGEVCVKGRSEWCVLDATTMGIRKMSSINHPEIAQFYGDNQIEYERFGEINQEYADNCEIKVVDSDIDVNNHTNNVAYAKMALETLNERERLSLNPKTFEIHFLAQSYLGDLINVCKYKVSDSEIFFSGKIKDKKIFEVKITK